MACLKWFQRKKDDETWTCTGSKGGLLPWDVHWTTSRFLSSKAFLYYRGTGVMFWLANLIWDLVNYANLEILDWWIIWLTHWTLLALVIYAMSSFSICVYWQTHNAVVENYTVPMAVQWTWFWQNVAVGACPLIMCNYWALVYTGDLGKHPYNNIVKHALNAVYMMIDVCLTNSPIWIKHIWQPMAFGIVYLIFSIIYVSFGGNDENGNNYIYNVMDWNRSPGFASVVAIITVVIVLPFWYILFVVLKHAAERLSQPKIAPAGVKK